MKDHITEEVVLEEYIQRGDLRDVHGAPTMEVQEAGGFVWLPYSLDLQGLQQVYGVEGKQGKSSL